MTEVAVLQDYTFTVTGFSTIYDGFTVRGVDADGAEVADYMELLSEADQLKVTIGSRLHYRVFYRVTPDGQKERVITARLEEVS